MTPKGRKDKFGPRIGLQVKFAMILTAIVLAATAAGGWLYCAVTSQILHQSDRQEAHRLAATLTVAAQAPLVAGDRPILQRIVTDMLNHPRIFYASIVDVNGRAVARAQRVDPGLSWPAGEAEEASLSYDGVHEGQFMTIVRPIQGGPGAALVGGVRLATDIRPTVKTLEKLEGQVAMIAGAIALSALVLGQLLVWRVLGVPIRRLVQAVRRLAEGDFTARVETRRNDELGELAERFDIMTERVDASQRQLRQANEGLERKVADRTVELEQANRRLRQEMAEKEDFLRAVSHDLNAPLRNIAGMAAMIALKWRGALPEDVVARLGRIQVNVDAQSELINELLELSRVRTRPERRERVDFRQLLEGVKDSFEYELKTRRIALTIGPDMPALHVERSRLRRVFQNLIDNAIKYMGDRADGRIDVTYRRVNGTHQFSVADNGPGIDPSDWERIFYVFRRSSSAANAAIPGKGVGLAFVRSVVGNYEGRAWVASRPGEGATFHVALSERCTIPPAAGEAAEAMEPALGA